MITKRHLYLVIIFLLVLLMGCMSGAAANDWTDSKEFSESIQVANERQNFYEHMIVMAQQIDNANECWNAIGTMSKFKCELYYRNVLGREFSQVKQNRPNNMLHN